MKIIKYFFEFISIISLFCIFKLVGLKNASRLGDILGRSIGPFFRSKKITKQNIRTGLGNLNEKEENKIIKSMWSNIGRTFAEYVFLKDFKFNKVNHMKIIGKNFLDLIKKDDKPVIFYSAHFANFELMAMELDKSGIKCAAIYRPLNNFFLNPLMEYFRMKYICPTQIPKGCRILQLSILLPTFSENSPLIKCGTPHINSTTSIPRVIEPIESLSTFPCSSVTCAASLSISLTRSSLNLKNILDLVSGGVLDQELNAFFAEIIACSTSSLFAKLTSAIFSPKAGLCTSPYRFDWLEYSLPLIK